MKGCDAAPRTRQLVSRTMPSIRYTRDGNECSSMDSDSDSDSEYHPRHRRSEGVLPIRKSRNVRCFQAVTTSESDDDDDVDDDGNGGDNENSDRATEAVATNDMARLDRLRRIFLSRPTAPMRRTRRMQQPHTRTGRGRAQQCASSDEDSDSDAVASPPPRQPALAIDRHVHALRGHLQSVSAQQNSRTQQLSHLVTQATDALKSLQGQEQERLQRHIARIRNSFSGRVQQLEQEHQAAMRALHSEMQLAIEREYKISERALASVAQRFQDEALRLPWEPPRPPTSSPPLHRHDTAAAPLAGERRKLRALEDRLSAFSPETVQRVQCEIQQDRQRRPRAVSVQASGNASPSPFLRILPDRSCRRRGDGGVGDDGGDHGLIAVPASPLRQRPSVWRQGISYEAQPYGSHQSAAASPIDPPLSRRFLRPEEEKELRALRSSIGLAADWMATHR